MPQSRKNFIRHNTGFTCLFCKTINPPAQKTDRNHCQSCLNSLHLDKDIPGDRKSNCQSQMDAVTVSIHEKKEYIITHRCRQCGHEKNNKAAPDDSREKLLLLINADLSFVDNYVNQKPTRKNRRKRSENLYQKR